MIKILNFIKNRKYLILLLISIISTIFILSKVRPSTKESGNESFSQKENVKKPTFEGINAGEQFDADKINEVLGFPTSSTSSGSLTVNEYRSSNEYRTNQIRIESGEVNFIKEVVNPEDQRKMNSLISEYGQSNFVLYEKESDSYFDLYVYDTIGLAYLAHQDGTLMEIWYFKPTDIDTFVERWAPNYQKEPFVGQTSH